jgi:hypothetical protein
VTDTNAPTPARLNILQLLDLAKNFICEMSPRVSVGIADIMLELVRVVDDDKPLLKDRVELSILVTDSADAQFAPAGVEHGGAQACVGTI